LKSHQPGRSGRTPWKHFLLNAIVGKIAGSLSTGRSACRPDSFYCVDLCGGDGHETEEHRASPMILHSHCHWLRQRGVNSYLDVIEMHDRTFERLRENTARLDGVDDWMKVVQGDSRQFILPPLHPDQAAFVHCDPNSVDQMPLTVPLVSSFNKYTMYLVTLGCNVAGLKRLPLDRRRVWFDHVTTLAGTLPWHHDAILFWLNRDSSQWAYLLNLPRVWSADFQRIALRGAGKGWPSGVSSASFRSELPAFTQSINRLFLTEAEYGNTA
jgi:hypothetical protein